MMLSLRRRLPPASSIDADDSLLMLPMPLFMPLRFRLLLFSFLLYYADAAAILPDITRLH